MLPFNRTNYLLPLLFGVTLAACEKEIDFKYHDIPAIPVIEGVLTPEGIRVGITLTTPMDEPMDLTRQEVGRVSLTDMDSAESFSLLQDEEGYYSSDTPGIQGHRYRLEVENEGRLYSCETEMYGAIGIISAELAWIKMPYDDVAVLQVIYTDNPHVPEECYWVRVYRNGKIYMWNTQSDRTAENGTMTFFAMTSRRDTEAEDEDDLLLDGDEVTIEISPISRTMHDYLEALGNDSSGPRLFTTEAISGATTDTPDFCLGCFMATTSVSTTLTYHPDEIQYAK